MSEPREGARFFTLARRIPTLVGRFHDGSRIWGGPYTVTQIAIGVVVAAVLFKTPGLWARFGVVGNVVLYIALVYAATLAAGRIPSGGRNPFQWIAGVISLTFQRRGGTRRGQVPQVGSPRRVRHRFNVLPDQPARH